MNELNIKVLTGQIVALEPLAEEHRNDLRAAAEDERIWTHTLVLARGPEFDRWFDEATAAQVAGQQNPFVVRRLTDGALVGSTSFLDRSERHRRVEIGSTWYHPAVWGTAVNPECKLLLMTQAFEAWQVQRVTFCTDLRNTRSRAAIAKLGATREGVLRNHMITQGGRSRDTVIFSIIASEWPGVKARLQARLAAGDRPFDSAPSSRRG